MTDPQVIIRKLSSMDAHVGCLRRRRPQAFADYRDDVDLQDAAAMSLLVAVQDALDIALHIAAEEGWGVASSYAEGFALIADRGVIDEDLALQLAGMASLRDRIAHGYASVDVERIWNELPTGIDALGRYSAVIARFLG